jgi:hypothetical protein
VAFEAPGLCLAMALGVSHVPVLSPPVWFEVSKVPTLRLPCILWGRRPLLSAVDGGRLFDRAALLPLASSVLGVRSGGCSAASIASSCKSRAQAYMLSATIA